jgi:hypothetical protein
MGSMIRYFFMTAIVLTILSGGARSQIAISKSDVDAVITNSAWVTYNTDGIGSAAAHIDLGSASASSQNFDFSNIAVIGIPMRDTSHNDYISPAGQHHAADYPTATVCTKSGFSNTFSGVTFTNTTLTYFETKNDGMYQLGVVSRQQVNPPQMFLPADTAYFYNTIPAALVIPLTLAMNLTRSSVDSSYNTATEIEVRHHTFSVNGFGSLKFPDGVTRNVLRYTHDEVIDVTDGGTFVGHGRNLTVSFLAQDGAQMEFTVDTTYVSGATDVYAIRFSKKTGATGVRQLGNEVPQRAALNQNYPNPFNPSTTVRYALPAESHVQLEVFNTLGQRVAVLADEIQTPGYKEATWIANDMPSGVYITRLQVEPTGTLSGRFLETRKMVLIK